MASSHSPRKPLTVGSRKMIIATKTRKTILEALFADGVLVANKNFNQKKHCQIVTATNLEVIMAMKVRDSCSFAELP